MPRTLQRGHSHIEQEPEIVSARELTRADLAVLTEKRPPNQVQRLRDTHHRIARAVAAGMRNDEIAATCGVSYNRVSTLRNDPAFSELVAHYRAVITAEYAATADPVIEFMATNALKAQAMLSDKLDDADAKGEFLPTRDLLGIAELGLDRTGYGKVNKNVNVNVDFAATLEAARARIRAARATATTIEGELLTPAPNLAPESASMPPMPTRAPALRRI
jgi:DNA-binding CsgD family transcriptional regulator